MIRINIFSIFLIIILNGCTVIEIKTPLQLSNIGKAQVHGVTITYLKNSYLGQMNLSFTSLDGKKLTSIWDSNPDIIELNEGKHSFNMSCEVLYKGRWYYYPINNYEISVLSGRIYKSTVQGGFGGCEVTFKDETNKIKKNLTKSSRGISRTRTFFAKNAKKPPVLETP
jgi:hypothetical protein